MPTRAIQNFHLWCRITCFVIDNKFTNNIIYYFVFINFNTFSFKLVLQNNFSHSTL